MARHSVRRPLWMLRVLTVAPYTEDLQLCWPSAVTGLFLTATVCVSSLLYLTSLGQQATSWFEAINSCYLDAGVTVSWCLSSLISFSGSIRRGHHISSYLQGLDRIDEWLGGAGVRPRYPQRSGLVSVRLMAVLALVSGHVAANATHYLPAALTYLAVLQMYMVETFLIVLLSLATTQISLLCQVVNTSHRCRTPDRCLLLQEAITKYSEVVGLAQGLTRAFRGELLGSISNLLLGEVNSCYITVSEMKSNQKDWVASPQAAVYYLWLMFGLTELYLLILPFAQISEQAEEFKNELYKVLLEDNSSLLLENEELSHLLAGMRIPKFTLIGFIKLDLSLIHSIAGAIATYTVILDQI